MSKKSIAQCDMFEFLENEDLGDLNRYKLLMEELESLPEYNDLLSTLEQERGNGRNDYPDELMLKSIMVKFIFQLKTVQMLRRELLRNSQLRKLIGLSDLNASLRRSNHNIVPSPGAYTNFLNKLIKHKDKLDNLFNALKKIIKQAIPDFGKNTAGDGKYYDSYTPNKRKHEAKDNRGEHDATYSIKEYRYMGEDGKMHSKKETHYGFRTQTLVDTATELPIACILSPANKGEREEMKRLFGTLSQEEIDDMETHTADRGYDSRDYLTFIRDLHIKPVIDNRKMRKGDKLTQYKKSNIYYTEAGEVFYYDENITDEQIDQYTGYPRYMQKMSYRGYDKDREAIRYEYKGHVYRLKINEDPRIFNDIARDSYRFQKIYNSRTSVERYHGRMDRDFCFEDHTIRNFDKMDVSIKIANIIMLGMAVLHIHRNQTNYASLFAI